MEFLDRDGDKPFFGTDRKRLEVSDPPQPGEFGYRLLLSRVWSDSVYSPWRAYVESTKDGLDVNPPLLALPDKPMFFTDGDSLSGYSTPVEFAQRLGLDYYAEIECALSGCVIVRFRLTESMQIDTPVPEPGASPGMTIGGAREWIVRNPVPINRLMTIHRYEVFDDNCREYRIYI